MSLPNVLGLELKEAKELLQALEITVEARETRSRRGVDRADSERVVRQEYEPEARVMRLTYAAFKTTI